MKRKIFSVLFALVLVLSLGLVTAVPAGATTADYNAAVIKAADRLAANQNNDGGFDWYLSDNDPNIGSADNCLGITAMGILKAYELEGKATYETALAKAYKYVVDTPPTWSFTDGKWKEAPTGVNSWPDVTFLVWLAEAAANDSSLLTAINAQVTTTAAGIADRAKTLWDDRIDYMGDNTTSPDPAGTATGMALYFRDVRGYPDCIPWDLEAAVKAAQALDAYYSGQGYAAQATEIANVIYDSLYGASPYFDITVPEQEGYIHGVTGALEAFVEVGLYPEKVTELKAILLQYQDEVGYWNWHAPVPEDVVESVQDTAYAVMALVKQGDADALVAAQNGAEWLISSQLGGGGWYAEGGTTDECLEVDSEAAWALYEAALAGSGLVVSMIAASEPAVIGISVEPTAIDFGAVTSGASVTGSALTVSNTGNVSITVDAEITADTLFNGTGYFYTAALRLNGRPSDQAVNPTTFGAWPWTIPGIFGEHPIEVTGSRPVTTGLQCPLEIKADTTYTGTVVFWAEQAP